ncbi:MAG: hypothetical protein ACPG4Z_03865 [Chitinophagales bacterium]
MRLTELKDEKNQIGLYKSYATHNYLSLNKDNIWISDTLLFDCNFGTWEYWKNEDMNGITLIGDCEKSFHFQIINCTHGKLIIKLNSEEMIELIRE